VRIDKMSKIRRTIAAQMVKSVSTIPHVTNFDDADVTVLEEMRKSIPKGYLGQDIKLTTMPFVMKAVAASLRQHPVLNASIDDENEQVVYKEYVNLGIAVDTPRGLVVPVMRGVDRMTIGQVAGELTKLAGKARDVSFGIEDLRGGTFTISNLGAVGGTYSTPVINHPDVAILLLGRSRWMPVVRDGHVEPRFMMPLSLSYDHRIVDGAAAARFLNQVIDYLEAPAKLLITG
jgi:pyruvate dehydrogenase E2 component (dihydrolipoamide acetyltransferase)